jgi:hypothetical protein
VRVNLNISETVINVPMVEPMLDPNAGIKQLTSFDEG